MKEKIKKIVSKYYVELIDVVQNIKYTYDVELSHRIFYEAQEEMENEIKALGNINDIFYQDND